MKTRKCRLLHAFWDCGRVAPAWESTQQSTLLGKASDEDADGERVGEYMLMLSNNRESMNRLTGGPREEQSNIETLR